MSALTSALALLFVIQQSPKPAAMIAFEEARKSIVRGDIEFSVRRSGQPDSLFTYRARFARNGDRILEEEGDADGWTRFSYDPERREYHPQSKIPSYYMQNREGCWIRQATTPYAQLDQKPTREKSSWRDQAIDIRFAGTYVTDIDLTLGLDASRQESSRQHQIVRWSEHRDGRKYEVSGWTEDGIRLKWMIDPDRGWNAESISGYLCDDGTEVLLGQCEVELAQQGGAWFPTAIKYTADGKVTTEININSCKVNNETDAGSFDGAAFGLEPGFMIATTGNGPGLRRGLRWSEEGAIPAEQWDKLVAEGKATIGPTLANQRDGKYSPLLTEEELARFHAARRQRQRQNLASKPIELWESYVRWFIANYQLNNEQTQKANLILADCRREAHDYLGTKRREIDEICKATEDLPRSGAGAERISRLLEPVEKIFHNRLKPRLMTIPTRTQKEAAKDRDPNVEKDGQLPKGKDGP